MLVGGLNLGIKNNDFLPSKDYAQKIVKDFIFLRQNVDHITEEDAKELDKILEDGHMKLEKVVQRVKSKKESSLADK